MQSGRAFSFVGKRHELSDTLCYNRDYYIFTFGLYGYYWYFVSLEELERANGKEGSGCLWTILLLVPIVSFFSIWHYSSEYADFVDNKYPGIAIFILWIVFSPAVWFLVQSDLNRAASR